MALRASDSDPALAKRWTVFKAQMEHATGLPVKIYQSSDYNGTIQAFASNQVDMAMIAGGGYANVDAQVGAKVAPILTTRQAEGAMGYYSALLVKKDSPVHSLADMKGRSLGYVDFNSTSGYLFPRAKMREQGIDPDTLFGKTSFSGGHTQSVMALENGQFDAAIIEVGGGDAAHRLFRRPLLYDGPARPDQSQGLPHHLGRRPHPQRGAVGAHRPAPAVHRHGARGDGGPGVRRAEDLDRHRSARTARPSPPSTAATTPPSSSCAPKTSPIAGDRNRETYPAGRGVAIGPDRRRAGAVPDRRAGRRLRSPAPRHAILRARRRAGLFRTAQQAPGARGPGLSGGQPAGRRRPGARRRQARHGCAGPGQLSGGQGQGARDPHRAAARRGLARVPVVLGGQGRSGGHEPRNP